MLKEKVIYIKDIIKDIVDMMNNDFETDIAFYHGTPIEANYEHQKDKDINVLKYPFIALFINGDDGSISRNYDINSDYFGTAQVWLVIMNECDFTNATTENIYDDSLEDVKTIYENFKQTIEKCIDLNIGMPTNEKLITHTKWGLVAKFSGKTSNVFFDKLAGFEITMNLPIIRQYENC